MNARWSSLLLLLVACRPVVARSSTTLSTGRAMDAASVSVAVEVNDRSDASSPVAIEWPLRSDASTDGATAAAACPRPAQRAFADAFACDFDGDGLRDWCSPRTPLIVARALADHTCSLSDEAVQFRVRAHCPWAPRSIVYPLFNSDQRAESNEIDALVTRTYCARIWGATAEATLRRARREIATGALAIESLEHSEGERAPLELTDVQRAQIDSIATSAVFFTQTATAAPTDAGVATASPTTAGVEPRGDGDEWTAPWDRGDSDVAASTVNERLSGASPAVRRECAQIEARAGRLVARFSRVVCGEATGAECDRRVERADRSLARCYPARGGAWALEATRVERDREEESGIRARVALRWLGDGGARASIELAQRFLVTSCDTHEHEVFGTSDYDGDNVGELVFRRREHWCGDGDGSNDQDVEVMTVREGRIARFELRAGARVVRADRAEDVDGDGRLDLWNDSYYPRTGCDPAAVNGSTHPVFPVLLHSVAGGGFVYDDEVTQRAFRLRCESLRQDWSVALTEGHRETDRLDGASLKERIVCARAAGLSAASVQSAVIRSLGSTSPQPLFMCNAIPVLSEIIAVPPPFARPLVGVLRWR